MQAMNEYREGPNVDGSLWTKVCGQKFVDGSLWTEVCGRKFVDGSLWTEVCGRKFVDGSLWTKVCGQKFVDGSESLLTTPPRFGLIKAEISFDFAATNKCKE